MRPVPAAARIAGRPRTAAAVALCAIAAAAALAVVAAGPGEKEGPAGATARHTGPAPPAPTAVGNTAPASSAPTPRAGSAAVTLIGGEALQSARCRQWRGASAQERDAVVETLAAVVGGPTPYGPASTLPAPAAHQLLDRACARTYARGFLLYELYTRAAAFYATPRRDL